MELNLNDGEVLKCIGLGLLLLMLIVGGCYYLGWIMGRVSLIDSVSVSLNDLLLNNFSYSCFGESQHYINGINISVGGLI